ncbi:uncharacterized protein LOC126898175 [Daktulosphaira vitifoliae]|uniref:uncharacterized protein LOC126898175 n=1 Tax=Daktulosphaira vitifoliae TaxID=58002 RepID=UPI0021AA2EA3|nr:uncharacterized protein LOC126898175 [Daktulosphaira vitifoliae]
MVVATKAPVKPAVLSTTTSAPKKVTSDDKNGRVATKEDFEFYARLAKLMILRKDNTEVTSKYSTWLKSLRNHENINTGVDYVRLMVMALQHPEPVCPFNDYPPADIDPLDCDPMEKARRIVRQHDGVSCVPPFSNPPVVSAVSEDRRQYAAYQTVPNAGVQCYYVRADEPMSGWNFPSTISKPDNPMHAGPLDWERSLAGILKKPRSIQNGTETSLESFVNSGSKAKYTFKDSTNACKILNVLQEGIDVGDGVFKWSEYSLLTGDTIPGSDLCIDWMVHEHERTQLEIDEEIINSFDKLYPGNFRLSACPELLEGIYRKFQCAQENGSNFFIYTARSTYR